MSFQNTKNRCKDAATPNASSTLTQSVFIIAANAESGTVRAGQFVVNAASGTANVAIVEALHAKAVMADANGTVVNVNNRVAAMHAELSFDINSNTALTNSHGLVITIGADSANSSNIRKAKPASFIAFGDYGSGKANGVTALFDIGYGNSTTNYVNSTAGVFNSNTAITNAGSLTVRVNGTTKYINLYSALA